MPGAICRGFHRLGIGWCHFQPTRTIWDGRIQRVLVTCTLQTFGNAVAWRPAWLVGIRPCSYCAIQRVAEGTSLHHAALPRKCTFASNRQQEIAEKLVNPPHVE
jgi:hypothetical protein